MREFKIVSNGGGEGMMLITKDPISKRDVIAFGLNEKEEVLEFQRKINQFVDEKYIK